MGIGNNSYINGKPKWLTSKKKSINGENIINQNNDLSRILYGLICSDVIIDTINKSFSVSKGSKNIDVLFNSIVSIDYINNKLLIFTLDEIPYELIFSNKTDTIKVENRLFTFYNTGTDPSCSDNSSH